MSRWTACRIGSALALAAAGVLLASSLEPAAAQQEMAIDHRWIGDRVLVTWAGDRFQGTNMAVVVTDSGLVVVDTGLSPSTVRRQRALVEAELGRRDFRYLVNTHMHNDHAFANEVFPEATVVGPAPSVASLEREVALIPELLGRLRSGAAQYGEWAAATAPESEEGQEAREGVAAFEAGIGDLERGITPRPPTLTFQGRHTLDLGDLTVEILSFPGLHSDSDVLIVVPEEGLLFSGDAFWGGNLPLLSVASREELEDLLATWRTILDTPAGLEVVVPGHSDVPLTLEQFRGMYAYVSRLWDDVRSARGAGVPLVRFLMGNVFAERYPEVADYRHIQREYNLHQHDIYVLWGLAGG